MVYTQADIYIYIYIYIWSKSIGEVKDKVKVLNVI